jgi:hypothetical protein
MTELLEGVHRIEAEVAGRPLYLFLFLGERRLLLDAGCSTTVAEFVVPRAPGTPSWPAQRDGDVRTFLAETRDFVDTIDELVQDCLAAVPSGLTLRDLIEVCNARLPEPWGADTAPELVYSLHGHVERLVHRGRATVAGDALPLFRWSG